jgi:hypothetical protein
MKIFRKFRSLFRRQKLDVEMARSIAAASSSSWSRSRFGKLKVPSRSRDDPAAVPPRARSPALQLFAAPLKPAMQG